ncbi:MAG: hypothetical protein QF464_06220 [Myxococcota bacterium]|jgi:hypothetical protein|nr:hypothetical protein [Myxococcota bacterium]
MTLDLPPFHYPDALTTTAFCAIVALVMATLVAGVAFASARLEAPAGSPRRRALVASGLCVLWLALTPQVPVPVFGSTVAVFMGFFAVVMVTSLGFALSPVGRLLAAGIPLWVLVGFQGFRLPLELVLHAWYDQGTVPVHITYEGQNFDIVAASVALAGAAWLRYRPADRWVAWLATVVGFGLLLNVIRVALGASPVPVPWNMGAEPVLQLPAYAPFGWIMSVCIGGAFAGYVITVRALRSRPSPPPE